MNSIHTDPSYFLKIDFNSMLPSIPSSGHFSSPFPTKSLHNEELNVLCASPNTIRVIKSRRIRWAGHVARMGERRGVYRVFVGKPEGKNHLGDPDVDGRIILRWIYRK